MPPSAYWFARALARRLVLVAAATVIGLQAVSMSVSMSRGPAHFHRASQALLVLSDFRRDDLPLAAAPSANIESSSHHHGAGTPRRHHHAPADPSVVRLAADRLADAAAEDGVPGLDLALAAFVAVVMTSMPWADPAVSHRRAAHAPWQPSTAVAGRIERPPQLG